MQLVKKAMRLEVNLLFQYYDMGKKNIVETKLN